MSKNRPHFTMPSQFLQLYAREMGLLEAHLPILLQGTQLPDNALLPGEQFEISMQQFEKLMENARKLEATSGIEFHADIGLRMGRQFQPHTVGPIGYLLRNAPDLVSALKAPAEFQALRVAFVETGLSFDEQYLRCELKLHWNFPEITRRMILESFAVNMQSNMESVLGETLTSAKYHFDFDAPQYQSRYSEFLHGDIEFEQTRNEILIPLTIAQRASRHDKASIYEMAHQQCQKMLQDIPTRELSTPDRVTRILLSYPIGDISEDDVAKSLYVSKRTLGRRLGELNTSYREIRDQLLASLSANYLRESNLSIDSIALLLGYQDPSNFRRAFKRWYKISPSQFRQHIAREDN